MRASSLVLIIKSKFFSVKFPSLIHQPNTQATKSSLFMNLRCSYMFTSCINNHLNLFLFLVYWFSWEGFLSLEKGSSLKSSWVSPAHLTTYCGYLSRGQIINLNYFLYYTPLRRLQFVIFSRHLPPLFALHYSELLLTWIEKLVLFFISADSAY